MEDVAVLEGCDSLTLGDGPVGALVLHGFTSSPQVVRPLAEFLAARGLAVEAPRYPGHGTTWQDCNRYTAEDWSGAVEAAFEKLAAERDEVFVVGFSFGAALAIDLLTRHQDRVAGFVALASFLHTKDPRRVLQPVIRRVLASIPGVGNDIAHPTNREIVYDRFPVKAGDHMLRFAKRAMARLPEIRVPLLVIHGRNDHTAHPDNAHIVFERASSEIKDLVWLERSYHVITLDNDADELNERTFEFIKTHSRHAL